MSRKPRSSTGRPKGRLAAMKVERVMASSCAEPSRSRRARSVPVDNFRGENRNVDSLISEEVRPQPTDAHWPPEASRRSPCTSPAHIDTDPEPEGHTTMFTQAGSIHELASALADCLDLRQRSPELAGVWVALAEVVTTKGRAWITPYGSRESIEVNEAYATDELIAAFEWLLRNEVQARRMPCTDLAYKLRAVATKTGGGSARAAQDDLMHGVTGVKPGESLSFVRCEYDQWAEFA